MRIYSTSPLTAPRLAYMRAYARRDESPAARAEWRSERVRYRHAIRAAQGLPEAIIIWGRPSFVEHMTADPLRPTGGMMGE